MLRIFGLTVLTLSLWACGGEERAPSPAPAEPPSTGQAEGEAAQTGAQAGGPEGAPGGSEEGAQEDGRPARRPLTEAQQRELVRLRREGRAAAGERDFATASARMMAALAIDPASPSLRCEAGYVAFRAGDLDQAATLIQQAVASAPPAEAVSDRRRRSLAMCLYNAGLVYEARGQRHQAHEAWTRSLELRPNRVVRGRLDALEDASHRWVELAAGGELDDYAERVEAAWCRERVESSEGGEEGGEEPCGASDQRREPSGAGRDIEASLLSLTAISEGEYQGSVLILSTERGAEAVAVTEAYTPGWGGITSDSEVLDLRYEDLLPGGGSEVVLELSGYHNDEDMGVCERTGSNWRATIVCTGDGPTPRCAQIVTSREVYYEYDGHCAETMDGGDPDPRDEPREERSGHEVTLTFEGGAAVVSRRSGRPPAGLVGRHPLAELLSASSPYRPRPL